MKIYICSECGREIPGNSDFCYHCGSLREKAHVIDYGSAQTPYGDLSSLCPECGLANEGDFKFCRHCGVEIKTVETREVNRTPPGVRYRNGYGATPVLQKNGGMAMLMAIVFGFVGIYGLGHLVMKKWSRGLMFLAMSAVNWYIYISSGTFPFFILLISLLLFFKQSTEITNIAYGRS